MKRIFLAVVMIILVFSLVGCGSSQNEQKNVTSTVTSSVAEGSYMLFQTDEVEEYLSFLEEFDESQYEIVNVDTLIRETAFSYNDDYYMITYKKIEQ